MTLIPSVVSTGCCGDQTGRSARQLDACCGSLTGTTCTVLASARNAAVEARARSRFQVTDEEVVSSVGALLGSIMESGQYPGFRDVLTSADRLDPKREMQVSVELILDGAAARIEAAS
jgi:hypothetical protein